MIKKIGINRQGFFIIATKFMFPVIITMNKKHEMTVRVSAFLFRNYVKGQQVVLSLADILFFLQHARPKIDNYSRKPAAIILEKSQANVSMNCPRLFCKRKRKGFYRFLRRITFA